MLGTESRTDEQRAEMSTLTDRAQEIEVELRAAIVAEPEIKIETTDTGHLDAEGRERLELRSKSQVVNYVQSAVQMRAVQGPEAEFNAALGDGRRSVPPRNVSARGTRNPRERTPRPTKGTWLDRLFDMAAARYLGVTFNSVSPGVASFPVTTAGASASQQAKSEATTAASVDHRRYRNATEKKFSSRHFLN